MFGSQHGFLVVTIASGLTAALSLLKEVGGNPSSIANILANELPKASTFFLTYILLQGLSGSAGGLLRIVTLVIYYVKAFILGSTPRKFWHLRNDMDTVAWGTLFPSITLLTVISEWRGHFPVHNAVLLGY